MTLSFARVPGRTAPLQFEDQGLSAAPARPSAAASPQHPRLVLAAARAPTSGVAPAAGGGVTCALVLAAGAVAVPRWQRRLARRWRRQPRQGGQRGHRLARHAWEVVLDLPVPSPSEFQAAVGGLFAAASSSTAVGGVPDLKAVADSATSAIAGGAPDLQAAVGSAASAVAGLVPTVPPEIEAALAAAVPEELRSAVLQALPPEVASQLTKQEFSAAVPTAVGGLAALLLLRQLLVPRVDELPLVYDYDVIEAYWQQRPFRLFSRFAEAGVKIGYYLLCIQLDEWTGKQEEMLPARAVQARELITDLGVTFIKTAQLWASRPDILPEAYIQEYQKLLEQVRPFGKDLALETLRRSKSRDGVVALDMFKDLSIFDEPIASASVGQVYKATLNGRTVAVKVQRPDVREQSTLDLYVIRNSCMLGSFLPIERVARQCKSTIEFLDLTAPTFIDELDYEKEAQNQRKFAGMVEECDLICNAVVVPEVFYSSKEVLVQEWLVGKKLTEPGAAQEQAGKVVKLLLNSYMVQFLETGYLHGDPHPGNFILMDTGKLGILDYGLMTTISPEKRLSFIEFLMHLQAKEYKYCLKDLIDLEFFPPELAEDQEALNVIVPTLANSLATLYEEGGDLKKKREEFRRQREAMKESGKLEKLQTDLREISKRYSGAFRLPAYFTLIIRAFATLEGLGLKTNENFAIVKECFPYIARRLIMDDSFRIREALRSYLYRGRGRIAVSRIDDLANGFGTFTNLMKNDRRSAVSAGAPEVIAPEEDEQQEEEVQEAELVQATSSSSGSDGAGAPARRGRNQGVDTATLDIAAVLFSPQGNFLQDLLIDEGVAAVDALNRAVLVQLLRQLGPLALPISVPLTLLTGSADDRRLLEREDKESLLVLRRITQLINAGSRGETLPPEDGEDGRLALGRVVEELRRLQPLAMGLLPTISPGVASFARRFVQRLASRILERTADAIEGRRQTRPSTTAA